MGKFINGEYHYQWELDGKRRPLPPLWKAEEAYGKENVSFKKPQYVDDGHCPWCGKRVENKRRKYCNNECRKHFDRWTVWERTRGAYSLRILYRDNFTCQDCGEFHARQNKHGIFIPIEDGLLDVHHILPVCWDGEDEPKNLATLCKTCHKKRHELLRKLIVLLKRYKLNYLIYPSVVMRTLEVDKNTAFSILEQFALSGFIEQRLVITCPKCDRDIPELSARENIPESLYCQECDNEIMTNGNCTKVYQVVKMVE